MEVIIKNRKITANKSTVLAVLVSAISFIIAIVDMKCSLIFDIGIPEYVERLLNLAAVSYLMYFGSRCKFKIEKL